MASAKFKESSTGGSATVVVGVSSGGMDALTRLVAQLPESFPAPVFVVQHMSADTTGDALVNAMNKHGKLTCTHARDGERFVGGRIYLAPSDHHLMIGKGKMLVTKGARENRSRPAIDPLFRSAAVAYGNRVIGVLLTGYLDDGTAGLTAIKRSGGTCVVQDPKDAAYPDMPQNALNRMKVDYCLPLAEMGTLLSKLVRRKFGKRKPVPKDIAIEAKIAERVLSDLHSVEALGEQVPFNCPGCGGVLWRVEKDKSLRFRCHTGHAFTAPVLLAEQTAKIEETLWVALRMFEERRNLLLNMQTSHGGSSYRSASERARESEVHIKRIRALLKSDNKATDDDVSEQ
ncbi:chemotaxis protein CheB [Hyalangium sp.]|uniref:chemotaxis protein CheB n=1 Tax=Hyalangium sp. TaxID=2028555 RepID=UPI0039C8B9B3